MSEKKEDGSTDIRGFNVPKGADYTKQEMWEWSEENEDQTVSSYRLCLDVEVTPIIEESGDDESSC